MNWLRIYNILFDLINPSDKSHPNYFSGTRFFKLVKKIDKFFPTYSQFIDERKKVGKSTSRNDYFYDVLISFDEPQRLDIVKLIIAECDKCDAQKIENLKSEIGFKHANFQTIQSNEKSEVLETHVFKPGELELKSDANESDTLHEVSQIPSSSIAKSKQVWYKQPRYFVPLLVAFIAGIFGIIHTLIPQLIKLSSSNNINQPIISMRVEPLVMRADSALYKKRNYLFLKIETSNGIYEIQKNMAAVQFSIKDSSYFIEALSEPNIILKEIRLDKFILDQRFPDITGMLIFENRFILSGQKLGNLSKGTMNEIAEYYVVVPYKYKGKIYYNMIRVPIIITK